MSKKIIINEEMAKRIIAREIIEESGLNKSEITSYVKDAIKNDKDVNKDIEKKVRSIVASTVNTLFKTLWQRHNFYEDEIKKG